jgi:hypothetical protein
MLENSLRVRCRNLRCRSKLPIPTENDHKAFCSAYCYNQFFHWKCAVCEREIPRGRHSKPRKCCRKPDCRNRYRLFPETYSPPEWAAKPSMGGRSQSSEPDSKNPCGTEAFFGDKSVRDWRWETSNGEHHLFFHDRHAATVSGVEGNWKIVYPITIPVQGTPTLEAGRKLAVNVALWTLPLDGATAARLARTNRQYREDAALIKTGGAPINILGGHRFKGAARLDPHLRHEIIATEKTLGEWLDWPPDEGAPIQKRATPKGRR